MVRDILLKNNLINVLDEYKNDLIISKINYRLLKRFEKRDRKIFKEILKFDDKHFCFGDYDSLDIFMQYINFGIYFDEELIGYFGFCDHLEDIDDTFSIAIILKDDYRNCKIGYVVIKQMLSYIFDNYSYINNIYARVLKDNVSSQKLFINNLFSEISGDDILCDKVDFGVDDYKQYVFRKKKYSKVLEKKYGNINIDY